MFESFNLISKEKGRNFYQHFLGYISEEKNLKLILVVSIESMHNTFSINHTQ